MSSLISIATLYFVKKLFWKEQNWFFSSKVRQKEEAKHAAVVLEAVREEAGYWKPMKQRGEWESRTEKKVTFIEFYVMKVKVSQSCLTSLWPHGLHTPWNSPGQNTRVDSCSFLQGIFPTQSSNPGLPHCRRILYQLSH